MFRFDHLSDSLGALPGARLLLPIAALPTSWQFAFAVVLGLIIGSFLTVLVHRLPIMLEHAWRRELEDLAEAPHETPHPVTHQALHGAPADASAPPSTHAADSAAPPAPHATHAAAETHAAAAMNHAPAHPATARYDLWWPRSSCTACGHVLRAHENIPVLSYVALGGKCAVCKTRIPARYPLLELMSALLAAAALARFGPTWTALAGFGLGATLLALGFIDAQTRLLPDALTMPLLWAGLLINLHPTFATLEQAVLGAAAGYVSLWMVYWAFRLLRGREGIGYGDFKLLAALGAWLGWTALPQIVLLASLGGALFGVIALVRRRLAMDQALAFGPFLAAAGVATLLLGTPLYSWP